MKYPVHLLVVIAVVSAFIVAPTPVRAQCSLTETFDGGFDIPWQLTDPALVRSQGDVLSVDFVGSPDLYHGAVLDPCTYTDFKAGVRLRDLEFTKGKAMSFRTNGVFVGYNVNLRSDPYNDVTLGKGSFSPASVLAQAPFPHLTGEWADLEIEAVGSEIRVYVNSALLISYVDPEPVLSGWVFLGINAGGTGSGHAEFDDFWIMELDLAVRGESTSWGTLKARFRDDS